MSEHLSARLTAWLDEHGASEETSASLLALARAAQQSQSPELKHVLRHVIHSDDLILGSDGDDSIDGTAGDDVIDGLLGADTMAGGSGDDTYIVDDAGDEVVEQGGEGVDTVIAGIDFVLAENVENLVLSGAAVAGTGNELDNQLTGNENDNLLDGGAGADTLTGGAGNDTYLVDSAGDVVAEQVEEGTDTVVASLDWTLADAVENLVLSGAAIVGTGNALNNRLDGNANGNLLDGGAGADTLTGGDGDDTYQVDHASDLVIEQAGEGSDTVVASLDWTLADEIENLVLTGAAIAGTGNALDNRLDGNASDNQLDGGTGADTLAGGDGDDTYQVDDAGDVVIEQAGEGSDTVMASLDWTLAGKIENLVLTGAAIAGAGNAMDNRIDGNANDNLLDGGAGADTLTGGDGDDTYEIDDASDVVIEQAGEGSDTVVASLDWTLASEIENLVLTGAAIAGTGNALANRIDGNVNDNQLDGGVGADTMSGGAGDDSYQVDDASDIVIEQAGEGSDTVVASLDWTLASEIENLVLTGAAIVGTGNALANRIDGNASDNQLDGGLGVDTMSGGAGNDSYVADDAGDVVVEASGSGNDSVSASVSYTLAANVENLLLLGSAGLSGTGNASNNLLQGNSGNNALTGLDGNDTLDGGTGADTMTGGNGDDTYTVDNSGDKVVEATGAGLDSVFASVSFTLSTAVENLTLLGSAALNGTGNSQANTLLGNSGANILSGVAGDDTLDGAGGNDSLDGGTGYDYLFGGDGNDTLTASGNGGFLSGDAGNDSLVGGSGADADILDGGSGNDRLQAGDGSDALYDEWNEGGPGLADTLDGGLGMDTLWADWSAMTTGLTWTNSPTQSLTVNGNLIIGIEALVLRLGGGADVVNNTNVTTDDQIWGGAGNDKLNGGAGYDFLYGEGGNDTLQGGSGGDTDVLDGGAGNDSLDGGSGYDNLYGGDGADTLKGGSGAFSDWLYGDAGNDSLDGGDGFDYLYGGDGNDTLTANIGGGFLSGDLGDDTLTGGTGTEADSLDGGDGSDNLNAGAGNDTLFDEWLGQAAGADTIDGGLDIDTLQADWSSATGAITWINNPNVVQTVNGNSLVHIEGMVLYLGSGNDVISNAATTTADKIWSGDGDDSVDGGSGNDSLFGGNGNDTLLGGSGADSLTGESGSDRLTGGGGADQFFLNNLLGTDTITDFRTGVDKLMLNLYSLPLGDGDQLIDGAATTSGPGGFSASAELVVCTGNIGGAITAAQAADAIGSASDAYAIGQTALFVVDNGTDTAVYYFQSQDANATVDAAELTLLATLSGCAQTVVTDYLSGA